MAHTSYDKLKDLECELDFIRKFTAIKEKSPGIFYWKSTPFLHFHDKDGERWADVREGKTWGKPLVIPFQCTKEDKKRFCKEVRRRYEALASGKDIRRR